MTQVYTHEQIETIKTNGFSFTLSPEIIKLISSLAEEVGAPTYIRTPNFKKKEKIKRKNKANEISSEDWDAIRQFQTTNFKTKEGIDKCIEDSVLALNKMTDTTYETQKDFIVQNLQILIDMETEEIDLIKISNAIFNTASSNKFYSTVYANLYKQLINQFDIIKTLFNTSFTSFIEVFNNIRYISPEENYDDFCTINKENEKRQSLSLFFTNLMKNEIISVSDMISIIQKLQTQISTLSDIPDKENEISELTENLFIIIMNSYTLLEKEKEWKFIEHIITEISELTVRDKVSINNKTIFKHLDMVEEFI